jgi:chromate transporter
MPMMYEQFCIRPEAVQAKDKDVVQIDKDEMYTGMGIVRALPGPVFSIASFAGGMALKDMGTTPEERGMMQLLGCLIGTIGIFLPSALLVLFFYPIWNNLQKYEPKTVSAINIIVIMGTFLLLNFTRIASPFIVMGCLLLGYFL